MHYSRLVLSSLLTCSLLAGTAFAASPESGWGTATYPATQLRRESRVSAQYSPMDAGFWQAVGFYYEYESGNIFNPRSFIGTCFGTDLVSALCFVAWVDGNYAPWTFPADGVVLDAPHVAARVVADQDFGTIAASQGPPGPAGPAGPPGPKGDKGDPGESAAPAEEDDGTKVPGLSQSPQDEGTGLTADELNPGEVLLAAQNNCETPTTGLWRYADASWDWCDQSDTWRVSWGNSACDIYADYQWASNRGVPWCYQRTENIPAEIGEYGWTSDNKLEIGGRTRFSRNETDCRAWHRDPESSNAWDICQSGDNVFIVSTAAYLGEFEWQTITVTALLTRIGISAANACNGAVGRQATLCALAPEAATFHGRGGSDRVYNGSRAAHPIKLTATHATVSGVECPIGSKGHYLVAGSGKIHNTYLVVVFAAPCSGASSFNTTVQEA